jgi:hypothetical protein
MGTRLAHSTLLFIRQNFLILAFVGLMPRGSNSVSQTIENLLKWIYQEHFCILKLLTIDQIVIKREKIS